MCNKPLRKLFSFILVMFTLLAGKSFSQTVTTSVFSDDYNRGTGTASAFSNGGTPTMTYNSGTTSTGTGSGSITRFNQISGSDYAMQILSADSTATTSQSTGFTYTTGSLGTFAAPFTTTLSANSGPVTWTFNVKTNRSSYPLSGFGGNNYGGAVMLAGTNANMGPGGGDGYAILFVKGITDATNNTVRLVKYVGGIAGGASTGGASASTTKVMIEPASVWTTTSKTAWVRVKVVYTPSTSTWELFTKNDSTSTTALTDFSVNMDSRGTNVDTSYLRNTPLNNFGFLWKHAAGSTYTSNTMFVDNFGVRVSSTNPTLASPTVSSITSISAILGATVTAGSPATLTARGTVYNTSTGVAFTDNALAEGGTSAGAFTQTRSGLSPQTLYYFKGYANNISNSVTYTSLSAESSFRTLSSPPTSQVSGMSGSAVSNSQIDLTWTGAGFPSSGATVKQYILLRAISPATPSFTATNGSAPSVGAGTTIVSSSISSAATTFSATALDASTTYNFMLIPYTFDGTNNATYNYLTSSAATASATTTAGAAPVLSIPSASSISNTSAVLGATIDSDGGSSITDRGTVYSTVSPVTISNNLLSEGGNTIGSFSHSRTGLTPETQYFFKGYAINGGATGLSTEGSFYTLSNPPSSAASNLTASAVSGEQINLSWSAATFPGSGATATGYVLLRAVYPGVPALSNSNGQAPAAAVGTTVVSSSIAGSATSASSTGLSGSTRYNYAVVPFTWNGVNSATYNYYTSATPTADATTLASTPSAQPTSLSFTSITCNGMTVNWTAATGSPAGYLVLQTNGATAPNTNPSNRSSYSVGASVGNATVAYVGSGSSFSLSSLTDNTAYNFKIYSFNGSGSNTSYLTTSPLSGSQSSSTAASPNATSATSVYSNEFTANWDAVTGCATGNYVLDVATTNNFSANGVIAAEDFENSLTLFTQSGAMTGVFKSGNLTASNDRPLAAPYASKGTYGFASYSTSGSAMSAIITSSNINTVGYSNPEMSFKLSALSVGASTGGQDNADSITVSVSPDGGATWYSTLKVNGNVATGNSVWGYNESGVASTPYDGNTTPVLFSPSSTGGVSDGTGYSTVKITGLPNTSNLRVNISMKSSSGSEYWVIDDFKVTGDAPSFSILSNYNGLSVATTNQKVSGLAANTTYYYRVRTVGNNGNSANSNVITVNTLAASAPTLNGLTVSGITHNSATLGATVTSAGSTAAITARGTVYKTAAGVTASDNALAEGGTSISSFTQNRTGLAPQTQYFFAGYASNASATGLSAESSFYTLSSPVTSAVTGFSATAISGAQIDLSWTGASFPSSGASVSGYVVLRALYPTVPSLSNSNGQAPAVGSGTTILSSSLSSAATSYSAITLSGLTRYNFVIIPFTWDGTNASTYNYYTTNAPAANATTSSPLADLPADQPTNLSFANVTCNGMTVNWSAASSNPAGYIVLQTSGATAPNTDPLPATSYSVGNTLGNATVAYIGSGTSLSLSSLSDNTNYNFKVYSFNGSGSLVNYLATAPLSGSNMSASIAAPVAIAASAATTSSFTANWNASTCATNYLLDVSTVDSFKMSGNVAQWSLFRSLNSDTLNSNALNQTRAISLSPSSTISYATGFSGSSLDSAVSTTTWNTVGKAWVVEINTTGYSNITVSSAQKSSASGPRNFRLEYKLGASGNYAAVPGGTLASNSTDWSTGTLTDVPLPSACDNQSSVFLRWVTTDVVNRGDGAATGVSSGGTNRIDNIVIKGVTGNYLTGYNGTSVSGASQNITGLTPNTFYYYRVRAVAPNSTSASSNTVTALTAADPAIADYRTKASGNFSDASIWEYAQGTGYTAATAAPTASNNITISVSDSVNLGGDFSINAGKTFTVNGKLDVDTVVVSGAGNFVLSAGSTIYSAKTSGLNGSIATTTKSLNAAANYVFDGTQAQTTAGLPSTVTGNITIANAAGVSWDASKTINTPGGVIVNSGASLSFGSPTVPYSITGTGNFTAKTGSTIVITSSAGILASGNNGGSMRLTGTRTFENNVNYTFSKFDLSTGLLKSYFGSAFGTEINSINNLTIDNPRGVADTITGSPSVTVNGNLNFVSGHLYKKSNKIILAPGATVTGTSNGWVIGSSLQKNVSSGANSVSFEVGTDSLNYTPVSLSLNGVTAGGDLTATIANGAHPSIVGSNISNSNRLNYYVTIGNSGVTLSSYNLTMNYNPANVVGSVSAENFIAGAYNGSSWSMPTLGTRTATSTQIIGLNSFGDIQLGATCTTSSTETISACDSYTWHGTTFTSSNNTATWVGVNSAGCDSTVTLNLTITPSTTNASSVSACDSYTWSLNGQTYTTSGSYTSVSGCVTSVLNLTITSSTSNTSVVSACDSYTWSLNGQTYSSSGSYTSVSGCATNILQLTITPSTSDVITIAACDSYTWSVTGMTYTTSGNYPYVSGCYTQTLALTITKSSNDTTVISACDSYTWAVNGQTYSSSGTYSVTSDCSTEVLILTIKSSSTSTSSASACDSYSWNGNTYSSTGSYSFTTTNAAGCDSIAVLNLTVTTSTSNTTNASACDSYTWSVNGQTYTTSGNYSSVSGCHTEILNLIVTSSTSNTSSASACDSYVWSVNGQTYTSSGSYTSVSGCATRILNLTITTSTSNTTTTNACDSYTWSLNGQTYTSSGSYTSVSGCATSILNLTITTSTSNTTTASACDTYTWSVNGQTYTSSGSYTSVSGCATRILNLTITTSTSNTTSASACDSYTWSLNGQTYTSSGSYTSVSGCATSILNLTITTSTSNTTTASACDSYTWSVNGQTYTSSGSYTSISGCATRILNLTITTSTSNTTTASACDTYTWSVNGQTYTSSGSYTSVSGCATRILNLTVTTSTSNTTSASACDSYTWSVNGQTYTSSGSYTSVSGCATRILNLTINKSVSTSLSATSCNSYTLPWGTVVTASGIYSNVYQTVAGCDSTVSVNVTINTSTNTTNAVSICSSAAPYTWNGGSYSTSGTYTYNYTNSNGCASTATLVLTIKSASSSTVSRTICSNQLPYTWNGVIFTAAGTQNVTLTNAAGCDSVVTMTLAVSAGIPTAVTAVTQTLVDNSCGARVYRYSAGAVANASGYSWTLPTSVGGVAGVTVDSGDATSSRVILVRYASNNAAAASGDSIKVRAFSGCGSAATKGFKLSNTAWAPLAAPTITATTLISNVCGGRKVRYSVAVPATTSGAVGFEWSFEGSFGGVIDSGTSTSRVIVALFANNAASTASDNVVVRYNYNNGCSYGTPLKKAIGLVLLAQPAAPVITATVLNNNICSGRKVRFSVPAVPTTWTTANAAQPTGYSWQIAAAGSGLHATEGTTYVIDSGSLTSRVFVIKYLINTAQATTDLVSCALTTACGTGARSAGKAPGLTAALGQPTAPTVTATIVTGTNLICGGRKVRYSVPANPTTWTTANIAQPTGYSWQIAAAGSGLHASLGTTYVIDSGSLSSNVFVIRYLSNAAQASTDLVSCALTTACGTGARSAGKAPGFTAAIALPAAPTVTATVVAGTTTTCYGRKVRYSVPAFTTSTTTAQATGYSWSFVGTIHGTLGTTYVIDSADAGGLSASRVIVVRYLTNQASTSTTTDSVRCAYATACGDGARGKVKVPVLAALTNCPPPTAKVSTPAVFGVNVYPNPSNGQFNVQLSGATSEVVNVRILDAQGRYIKAVRAAGNGVITLGSDLKAGAYMLEVRQGNNVKTTRVLKF